MSQVGISRPATQQSLKGMAMPEIQHPLSRLGNPEKLDVRGMSRGGSADGLALGAMGLGRPLTTENEYAPSRRSIHSSAGRQSRLRSSSQKLHQSANYDAIPEGVEVRMGDPNKTKMPIFGSAAGFGDRSDLASRAKSRMSTASAQARLEIDELEALLREKVTANFFEVKKRFRDNDPENKGNVSKEALYRIIVTLLNRPVGNSQFGRLMDRLGLKDRNVVSFTDFFAQFRETVSSDYPKWMDPIQRQWQERATMNAAQVHAHLKEKARQRVLDIVDLVPQCNPDGSGHILKPEFRNALNQLGFFMDDVEFERLWGKYDADNSGTINGEHMMKQLGIFLGMNGAVREGAGRDGKGKGGSGSARVPRKKEIDRQRSLDVERWLKQKFREGFQEMRKAFEDHDKDNSGTVRHDSFLNVLAAYGLRLDKDHLAEFLARCSVQPTNTHVPYREFLHRFQDRGDNGMSHKILTNPNHRYNRSESPGGSQTGMSAIEAQLMNMFQRDFLAVLGTFHKIDKLGLDYISQEEFRAALESRFNFEISDAQFASLIDKVPLDEEGQVKYAEFMAQFDTRGKQPSLFASDIVKARPPAVGALPQDPLPPAPSPPTSAEINRLVVERDDEEEEEEDIGDSFHRSHVELSAIIKDLLKNNYQGVERAFQEIDELNTGRLSKETMYQLLKRFRVSPEVTRGEIRDLWKSFITNTDKTLDFLQFTRHFGYSLRSAAFPNAKANPPKRGDADFMIRSRKLNCAADMLQDNLRSKIDYMWEDLRKEFVAMDPYGTGYVEADEFRDVVQELCVHLSTYELNMLTHKFTLGKDGRVSYIEFLKPFALRKQQWRHGNNMLALLQHPNAELPMQDVVEHPQKGLHGITAKLRQKIAGDWKNLRRAFRKLDESNTGLLSLPEFRSVLKLANVVLDEEEVYQLMSQFDRDLSGKMPYNRFLDETFKPQGRQTPLRKSAQM